MSKIEEMQISIEELKKQVDDTLLFADDVKAAIKSNGVEVADGTPVSEYAGKIEGLFDAGKKTEYDEFWDAFQQNGDRTHYAFAFAGKSWNATTFKPKYDIFPTQARMMFSGGLLNVDLVDLLNTLGIIFDTSNVASLDGFDLFCEYGGPKRFPTINTTSCPRLYNSFFYANMLVTIDKLILKSDGSQLFNNPFIGCTSLKYILVEGTIGQNKFDTSWSPLDKASLTSIVNALSSTTTGLTVTLRLSAVNKAFETSEGANDGSTSEEWQNLTATKSNWTISLIDS